jgi:tRNA 2-thiouridine synthesizing protein B
MTPLHTIHRPGVLAAALPRSHPGDSVLLLEDGVYAGLAHSAEAMALVGRTVYLLLPDLIARGLQDADLAPGLTPIDMQDFVALTIDHSPIIAWL